MVSQTFAFYSLDGEELCLRLFFLELTAAEGGTEMRFL